MNTLKKKLILFVIFELIFCCPIAYASDNLSPQVRIFDAESFNEKLNILAYDENFRGGVNLSFGDVDGDGFDEIIAGAGPGGGVHR